MPQMFKREFYCDYCDKTYHIFKWTDDEKYEYCNCGQVLEEFFDIPEEEPYFNAHYKKVHSLPINEKKRYLRKRADDDYRKNHKEKKEEIDRQHDENMKGIVKTMKEKQIDKKTKGNN